MTSGVPRAPLVFFSGDHGAMRAYLHWETELPAQIAADGLAGFRIAAP